MKPITSVALIVVGAGAFLFGYMASNQAAEGEQQIFQAEQNGRERRPVLGPVRRGARNQATETRQQRLNQAQQGIIRSEVTAHWLQGTGIILFLIGLGGFLYRIYQKKSG